MQGLLAIMSKALGPAAKVLLKMLGATAVLIVTNQIATATREWAINEMGFDPWKNNKASFHR